MEITDLWPHFWCWQFAFFGAPKKSFWWQLEIFWVPKKLEQFFKYYSSIHRAISILLLGYEQSGKTEIGHALSGHTRLDFTSTKGVRMFNIDIKNHAIKLLEIGGSDTVRGIWPHYFSNVRAMKFHNVRCETDENTLSVMNSKKIIYFFTSLLLSLKGVRRDICDWLFATGPIRIDAWRFT